MVANKRRPPVSRFPRAWSAASARDRARQRTDGGRGAHQSTPGPDRKCRAQRSAAARLPAKITANMSSDMALSTTGLRRTVHAGKQRVERQRGAFGGRAFQRDAPDQNGRTGTTKRISRKRSWRPGSAGRPHGRTHDGGGPSPTTAGRSRAGAPPARRGNRLQRRCFKRTCKLQGKDPCQISAELASPSAVAAGRDRAGFDRLRAQHERACDRAGHPWPAMAPGELGMNCISRRDRELHRGSTS